MIKEYDLNSEKCIVIEEDCGVYTLIEKSGSNCYNILKTNDLNEIESRFDKIISAYEGLSKEPPNTLAYRIVRKSYY